MSSSWNDEGFPLWLVPIDFLALGLTCAVIGTMAALPDATGLKIARVCIKLLLLCLPRARKVGLRNLELVFPERTPTERSQILERSFEVLARNLHGFSKIPKLDRASAATRINHHAGKALIDNVRTRAGTNGILLPTLHFGAFELLVQFQSLNDRPFAFLARGFGLPRVDRWWNRRRQHFGSSGFTRKGGYQEIVRRIRAGEDVGVLFDQNVKVNHAVFVDFFGIPAATSKSIAVAALRTKCPIIFAACVDNLDGTYELVAEQVANPVDEPGTAEEKIYSITRDLHDRVETLIKRRPEQWFWIHRRFKTRPTGDSQNLYA